MELITMPQLGETVTEGTITAWAVAVGDAVEVDDALFEVSTEKVDTEVPAAVAGHLRAILVGEGETVAVGAPVAVVTATADEPFDLEGIDAPTTAPAGDSVGGARGGDGPEVASRDGSAEPARSPVRHAGERDRRRATTATGDLDGGGGALGGGALGASGDSFGRGPAGGAVGVLSPVVRRLLSEHSLDATAISGSGRDGRITRADVLAAAAQRDRGPAAGDARATDAGAAALPRPGALTAVRRDAPHQAVDAMPVDIGDTDEVVDLSKARLATAEHMVRSLATAAHALVAVEVDYSAVDTVRRSVGLSFLPFVARAVIDSIREFPHVNASFTGERLVVRRAIHLGVAVDVDQEALVVPVVRDADRLRLPALAAAVADVADRARRRRLGGDELSGGTFTLTNVGSYGTLVTAPIINQPQVAILSTDGVRMAPVAVRLDGQPGGTGTGHADRSWGIAVHPVGNLCLSFDHRAFDGAYAAAFLARVREHLQERDWGEEMAP